MGWGGVGAIVEVVKAVEEEVMEVDGEVEEEVVVVVAGGGGGGRR